MMNNLNWKGKLALIIGICLITMTLLTLGLGFFTSLGFLGAFRIIFGSVYVLFLPGFILTFVFFPIHKEIDWIERIALSFALSIAVVPLIVFYLNLIGLKISTLNTTLTIAGIIMLEIVILAIQSNHRRKKNIYDW
jgi:uncharacterized membrane protein